MKLSAVEQGLLDLARTYPGIAKAEAACRLGVRPKGAAVSVHALRLLKPSPSPEDSTYGQLWPVETGDSP